MLQAHYEIQLVNSCLFEARDYSGLLIGKSAP